MPFSVCFPTTLLPVKAKEISKKSKVLRPISFLKKLINFIDFFFILQILFEFICVSNYQAYLVIFVKIRDVLFNFFLVNLFFTFFTQL